MLHLIRHGQPSDRPTLLIAHGLFGSARNWGAIARRLAEDRQVIAVDMRNHGESPRMTSQTYPEMAADLAEVIRAEMAQGGRAPCDVLGHSMGGKAAMMLALSEGALVNRMIVADIAPVAYPHSHDGLIAAMRGLDLTGLASRAEVDRRLAASVPDAAVRAFLLQSLDLAAVPPRWRLGLDVLSAGMAALTGWPEVSGRFDGPVLILAGALSDYVRPEHRATILRLFPAAKLAKIPGAGHWLHAERPREFEAALRAFLG